MAWQTGKELASIVTKHKKSSVDVYISKVMTWDNGVYTVNLVVEDAEISGKLVSFTTWTGKTYTMRTTDTVEVYINHPHR